MSRRAQLLEAGRGLLASASLVDVTAFLGPRPLAAATGAAPATVSHHFPAGGGSAARAVVGSAVEALGTRQLDDLEAAVAGLTADSADGAAAVLAALAGTVEQIASTQLDAEVESAQVAYYLAVAVAPRDPAAASLLLGYQLEHMRRLRDVVDTVLVVLDRSWATGLGGVTFCASLLALARGFVTHERFDPDGSPPDLFADMAVRMLLACTQPAEPAASRTAEIVLSIPAGTNLSRRQHERIAEAARELYAERGWAGVDARTVCARALVSPEAFAANYRDRHGLAPVIWRERLPQLRAWVEQHADDSLDGFTWGLLERLAAAGLADRALAAGLMRALNDYAAATGTGPADDDSSDPRTLVSAAGLLHEVFERHADQFRLGFVGTRQEALDSAALVLSTLMVLVVNRGGEMTGQQIADRVFGTVYAGMRATYPERP